MEKQMPNCPYCGAEMIPQRESTGMTRGIDFMQCSKCAARSPEIRTLNGAWDGKQDAARAAAMQRYVEPTEKEIRTCATCASYRPSEFTNRVFCAYHSEDGHDYEIYADDYCSYWEHRPTDEERANARWED